MGLKDSLNTQLIDSINHKPQKVGMCSWTSSKRLLQAIIYAALLKKFPDEAYEKELNKLLALFRNTSLYISKKADSSPLLAATYLKNLLKLHNDYLQLNQHLETDSCTDK